MKRIEIPDDGPIDIRHGRPGQAGPGGADAQAQVEHEALLRVAAAAAGASGLEDVLELAAEEARHAIGAASLAVSRWEDETSAIRTLINVGELGPGEQRFPEDETYPAREYPLIGEMIESGRPYFNSLDDANCRPEAAALLRQLGKSSELGVPIVVEGESWGEIWASKAVGEPPFRAEDVSFLEAIAGQFATAIARAELFSRVSRLAYEDSLTGLPNRRALDERLERALRRFQSGRAPLSILLCDLDHLKLINDTRGHEAGDHALRRVAETLVAEAADRPGAFVARVSGDEFCVLLDGHRLADAVAVGAAAVRTLDRGPEVGLSLSCGAATATAATGAAGELLRAADTALYAAKRRGGGQVLSSTGAPPPGAEDRRQARDANVLDPVLAATEFVVADLDGRLADAPVLDRLEAVASAYTEAADLAGWTVSVSAADRDVLVDLSLGDNRAHDFTGIRVGPGTDEFPLSDFPVTEKIIAAGSGSFVVHRGDESTDARERELLGELGFESVIGVAAADDDDVYLIELYGDRPDRDLTGLATPLRLAADAAIPPRTRDRRKRRRRGAANARGSELSLAVARRLEAAERAEAAVEGTADELQRAFGCHVVHVARLRGDRVDMWAESGRSRTPPGWSQDRNAGLIGRCLREQQPVIASDVRREPQFRGSEGRREVRSELAVPLRVAGEIRGAINLEHTEVDFFDLGDARLVQAIGAQLGGALHAIELYAGLEQAYMDTAEALAAALEAKDPDTARHSSSIVDLAVAVGERLAMEGEELRTLRYGAAFHDIGKLAIPRRLLNKPGPLTAAERQVVEQHTLIGERILAPIEFLAPVLPLVRHAHERWDGRGYPDGLAGTAIPLGARVVFACDAYDAMSSDRPYRAALAPQEVRAELQEGAGGQFDPAVVEALLAVLDERAGS